MAWHYLQYVLGLKRLGHEVMFIEDSEDYPACYDPTTNSVGDDPTYGLAFTDQAFKRLGLGDAWAYYNAHTRRWMGSAGDSAVAFCRTADLLLNVSGVNPLRDWTARIPVRALIDTDPVFTQVRHLTDSAARSRASAHTDFFSFGELFENGESRIPNDGIAWRATRQPIVLDAWPLTEAPANGRFTTVMLWDSYPAVEHDGRRFGVKAESFARIVDLPRHVSLPLEIALGSVAARRRELVEAGWLLRNPLEVTYDPWIYQQYLQQSRGEISVAKQGYVAGCSGWFSERSAGYLASGRPVIVQDTGFSKFLPTGVGLHSFRDLEGAIDAIHRVEANHDLECRRAREIAEEYFDANRVLPAMLESMVNFS